MTYLHAVRTNPIVITLRENHYPLFIHLYVGELLLEAQWH